MDELALFSFCAYIAKSLNEFYNISGQSDGFPAYEFFITDEATGNSYFIFGSNPAATGDTPRALFPPMENKINASGNSGSLQPVEEVKFDR